MTDANSAAVAPLLISLLPLLGALAVGAMSPGPSFLFVARTSLAVSRPHGLATALGMGLGAVAYALLVMLGLQALLTAVPWVYAALQVAGGAYLLYLAWKIWRGAKSPLSVEGDGPAARGSVFGALAGGLFTQLSNPKTAVVYGSLFAALLPRERPAMLWVLLPILVFVIEAGWYALVAFVLSSARPRQAYLRSKGVIDRVAGAVMGLLGVKLLASVRPPA